MVAAARERGLRVNAVAPGFIESEMTKTLGDALINEAKKHIPARRLGKPEEVASAAASSAAAFVGLAVATGFERKYKVLKRFGATPVRRLTLVLAKTAAIAVLLASSPM